MHRFHIIAFTHQQLPLEDIGKLHIADEQLENSLKRFKVNLGLDELLYLSTCNRVEFMFATRYKVDEAFRSSFFAQIASASRRVNSQLDKLAQQAKHWEGIAAVQHLFRVASSMEALVVGEREIITQVREAYERCKEWGLTGDTLRLVMESTVKTAKEVYTETNIAKKPVSVVSLAYRKLKELQVPLSARFLIIGAGQTNTAMARFLKKHGYANFAVFNRTLDKARALANELGGAACLLNDLDRYTKGFDVLITCTGSDKAIIHKENYSVVSKGEKGRKIVIDLAVPNDFDKAILKHHDVNLIAINNLKEIAEQNLRERQKELVKCGAIIEKRTVEFRKLHRARLVELAMQQVPQKVKEINDKALKEVFAKDIETLDDQGRQVLDRVVAYIGKKYISGPMKLAKDIMLEESQD